jgi:hypothetical protein
VMIERTQCPFVVEDCTLNIYVMTESTRDPYVMAYWTWNMLIIYRY